MSKATSRDYEQYIRLIESFFLSHPYRADYEFWVLAKERAEEKLNQLKLDEELQEFIDECEKELS